MDRPLHPHSGEPPEDPGSTLRDAELESLVARTPLPPARGAFRDTVRDGFLGGTLRASEPAADSSPQELESGSRGEAAPRTGRADVKDLEKSVSRTPLAPEASAEFREDLRRQFLTGRFPEGEIFESEDQAPAGRLLRFLLPVAAVAAIVLVTIFTPGLFGERTFKARILGDGSVRVAGVELGSREQARIGVEAALGGPIEVGDSALELVLTDRMVLELQPDTTLELDPLPPAGSGETFVIHMNRGRAFLKTLDEGVDFPVLFTTEEAWVQVVGTSLSVMAEDGGTCVCVGEGEVKVTDRTDPRESFVKEVTTENTLFIHKLGAQERADVPFEDMDADHIRPILEFTHQ